MTSSEETYARQCIEASESPDRLIEFCRLALDEGGLTDGLETDLLVGLGSAQHWADDPESAEATFRRALSLSPSSTAAWNGLGWALRDNHDLAEAADAFRRSLDFEVTASALMGRAAVERVMRTIDGYAARDLLLAALVIEPKNGFAQREIGWSFFDEGRYPEAVAAFQVQLERDASDLNAIYGLGRAELNAGDPEAALAHFNRVLEDVPDDSSSRIARIVTLRRLERNRQALREADRLIAEAPDLVDAYIQRGLALNDLERRSEALETFRTADETLGPDNTLLYWYADTLAYDGQMKEALSVIERATGLNGADEGDHLLRSWIALELKDYSLARSAAEDALSIRADEPWAHFYMAIAHVHSGDVPRGLEWFETAISEGLPDNLVGTFAQELMNAGKFVEAVQLRLKY